MSPAFGPGLEDDITDSRPTSATHPERTPCRSSEGPARSPPGVGALKGSPLKARRANFETSSACSVSSSGAGISWSTGTHDLAYARKERFTSTGYSAGGPFKMFGDRSTQGVAAWFPGGRRFDTTTRTWVLGGALGSRPARRPCADSSGARWATKSCFRRRTEANAPNAGCSLTSVETPSDGTR